MTLVTFGETALRFSPPAGYRFETADEVSLHADGIASNAATTATRLGGDAVWMSKLPDTPLGRSVAAKLHERGLETDIVWADSETGRQGLTFYEDASPPRSDRLLQDRSETAMGTLIPGEIDMQTVQDADVVFTAGSTLALSETVAETTGALLRSTDGISALDLDFHPNLWSAEAAREEISALFDAVDLLFVEEQQAVEVFDLTGTPRELVHSLASANDLPMVVLSRSGRGAVAYYDGVVHEHDAIETDVVDDSGKQAAFVGAFLERMAAGDDVDAALMTGLAAGAIAQTIPGPLPPIEAAEVEQLVETQR